MRLHSGWDAPPLEGQLWTGLVASQTLSQLKERHPQNYLLPEPEKGEATPRCPSGCRGTLPRLVRSPEASQTTEWSLGFGLSVPGLETLPNQSSSEVVADRTGLQRPQSLAMVELVRPELTCVTRPAPRNPSGRHSQIPRSTQRD